VRNLCTASCLCSGVSKYVKQEITDLLLRGVMEYVKSNWWFYWVHKYLKWMCPVGV